MYERILELDPDNKIAKDNINAISAAKGDRLEEQDDFSELDSILSNLGGIYFPGVLTIDSKYKNI